MRLWHGCSGTVGDPVCDDGRCPACGADGRPMSGDIHRLRYKHGVPSWASSGLDRWSVRSATSDGVAPRAWAVGDGMGEDVEIHTHRQSRDKGMSGDGDVTLGKILYFFDHSLYPHQNGPTAGAAPLEEWVLVHEYITCGLGRGELRDSITKPPTDWLQGNAVPPSVFPVSSIRRHVHMYHLCPLPRVSSQSTGSGGMPAGAETEEGWVCGRSHEGKATSGKKVWIHKYRLAAKAAGTTTRYKYMLNEHWHIAFQDGVI